MTAFTRTPENTNLLQPTKFLLTFGRMPATQYFCQEVNLPGITLGAPEFGNPFASAPIPGEHLTYDELTVQFLVDEQMLNYNVLYNWIVALGFPENYQQYTTLLANDTVAYGELAKNYSDATLEILDSNNNVVRTVTFYDVFPTALETVTFSSTNTDVPYVVGQATFKFGYFKFA